MLRFVSLGCALAAIVLLAAAATADDKNQKPQMVNGTIKTVDVAKSVLVINQKVKKDTVDRELSITESTKFVINNKEEASGKDGLRLLEGKEGSSVKVKCDKDVNVLQVNVMLKK